MYSALGHVCLTQEQTVSICSDFPHALETGSSQRENHMLDKDFAARFIERVTRYIYGIQYRHHG